MIYYNEFKSVWYRPMPHKQIGSRLKVESVMKSSLFEKTNTLCWVVSVNNSA